MMISNQYQTQPNFQGNLLKEGIKLPKRKFNAVAKMYAEKTEGLPDLKLLGRLNNSDYDGRFYHTTCAMINGEDVASIPTASLKKIFKEKSPKAIVQELINVAKENALIDKRYKILTEIERLEEKINVIKNKIKYTDDPESKKRLQVLSGRMEKTFANLKKSLEKIQNSGHKISNEWCI